MQRPGLKMRRWFRAATVLAFSFLAIHVDRAAAQSGSVVVESSRIYVFVAKKGAGHEHGVEGRITSGEIHLERAQQVGTVTFGLQALAADTAAARKFFNLPGETDADTQAQVNANMHGAAVLDVARFPSAEWVITQAQALPREAGQMGTPYQLDGELTLHGVKRALRIVATAETVNGLIRLRGRFAIKQTDYGVKPYSKFLGAVGIADELQVYGDLWLRP